jgi:hypothetical protein
MADSKITALTALTAADPVNDMFPVVDVSDTTMAASGTTKKISVNNILGASGTATLASATITGALTVDTTTLVANAAGYTDKVGIGTATPDATLDVTSAGTASTYTVSAVIQDGTYPASGHPTLELNGFIGGNGYRSGIGSIGGQQLAFYTPTTFGVAPTRRMVVDSSGNLALDNGNLVMTTSGKGIDFSAVTGGTGTATANVLNDYEEGTFTPSITFGGASVGLTASTAEGRYTKVGRVVTVSGIITLTSKGSSTGNAKLTGLPFTSSAPSGTFTSVSLRLDRITFLNVPCGYIAPNVSAVELENITTAGVVTNLTDLNFANACVLIWNCTYTAA